MVGRDAVAEHGKRPRAPDIGHRIRVGAHIDEIGRAPDIGRTAVPVEQVIFGCGECVPLAIAREDVGVAVSEHLGVNGGLNDVLDLLL